MILYLNDIHQFRCVIAVSPENYLYLDSSSFPSFLPREKVHEQNLCQLVDERDSCFWIEQDGWKAVPPMLERCFLENLDNDAPRELELYSYYSDLLSREYPSCAPMIQTPCLWHDTYCGCPACGKDFDLASDLGMIRCPNPSCRILLNNPLWNHDQLVREKKHYLFMGKQELSNLFYDYEKKCYLPVSCSEHP